MMIVTILRWKWTTRGMAVTMHILRGPQKVERERENLLQVHLDYTALLGGTG